MRDLTGQSFLIFGHGDVIELFGDIQEATVEALESASGLLIGDRRAVHVENMACSGGSYSPRVCGQCFSASRSA